jgi:hypothetical protein
MIKGGAPGSSGDCETFTELSLPSCRNSEELTDSSSGITREQRGTHMNTDFVGLVAVIMIFGIPMAAMYTYYRVRKLRTEERMAALAREEHVPMQPDLSEAARSRRFGILLVTGALGYMTTFGLIARAESDAWIAATFGIIPFTLGLGFFLDSALIRRDLRA